MKKKVLIVNKSFDTGGIQSSMINMANELSEQYQVDLFIYEPQGAMRSRLKESVTVIPASWRFRALGVPFKKIIKCKNLKIIMFRVFATVWSKLMSNDFPIRLALKHEQRLDGYDLAIAFHQEQKKKSALSGFVRVVDECVTAKTKVAWLHYDCSMIDLDHRYNSKFYQKMDAIVCVSDSLKQVCEKKFPTIHNKIMYCYNFLNYTEIKKQSEENQKLPYNLLKINCFSACRLTVVKAIPRAIHSLGEVFRENPDVMWYIAGDGPERENILNAIRQEGLEEQILLIGNQSNPYCYMKNADLVMNVSYHEAAPMVYFEAKALGIPVFATRTSSSDELLRNGEDSFICENSEQGLHDAFQELMTHKERLQIAKNILKDYSANNDASLKKVQEMIEGTIKFD